MKHSLMLTNKNGQIPKFQLMAKKYWLMVALLWLTACGNQEVVELNQTGNDAFAGEEYNQALESYLTAQAIDAEEQAVPPQLFYNAGNSYYRLNDYETAILQAHQSLRDADEPLAQQTFYNMGNMVFLLPV